MESSIFNNIHSQASGYTAPPVASAPQTSQTTIGDAVAASKVAAGSDTVQISKPEKEERKGLVKSINEGIGNFKKFMASAETYSIAGFKGFFKGAVAGSLAFAGGMLINEARKIPSKFSMMGKNVSEEVINQANTKIAKLAKNNKFIGVGAAVLGVATFVGTLWKANLDLNEKKSAIDHRFVGHKQ